MAATLAWAIDRLLDGEDLGRDGAADALETIMSGDADPVQTGAFLIALRAKGESAEELAGLAAVIRRRCHAVALPAGPVVDTCGTGGGPPTFNISTTAAFVVAGAGVSVAKHGNRSVTSRCGSADVLEALGARIDLAPDAVSRCLEETGVGFMFAPLHHPAFAHIVPVRRALGVRTIFNLLGPLTSPAGVRRQVIGVAESAFAGRLAEALLHLGTERALLVTGSDGLDEISCGSASQVTEVCDGTVSSWRIEPATLGFSRPANGALAGGDPQANAEVTRAVLSGRGGSARDVVVLNAGAALWVSGARTTLEEGLAAADESIRRGAALERLEAFVAATGRLAAT